MDYFEVSIAQFSGFDPEIIIARMAGLGFESFSESESGIQCYIPENVYDEPKVNGYLGQVSKEHGITWSVKRIADQNWNAIWESDYEPVTIAGKCQVRAPFHPRIGSMQYDIVIEPRMSFGTAHHETTAMMLELLMLEEVSGKQVVDMGCGTGVLAVLASKMQAATVIAIDNDQWAYSNAVDNMAMNDARKVKVILGDSTCIPLQEFDVILANINRNVLLNDITVYAGHLRDNGILLVSGFYTEDLDAIMHAAGSSNLRYITRISANNWTAAKFIK